MTHDKNPFRDLSQGFIATDIPLFHKEKHVSYWLRCLRSPLPHHYTSNDSNRMTLAFFTIAALDLLGVLFTRTTPAERHAYVDRVYRCQHPSGGFRGSPGTDVGARRNKENEHWDTANTPATYFALSTLIILGDDLTRVDRRACLSWLNKMQREDGNFGESLGENDQVLGGSDTRFGYCSVVTRWILRGNREGTVDGVPDIRVDDLVDCIRLAETHDGGISDIPFHEAQAGFTFCALAALAFLNRLPRGAGSQYNDGYTPYSKNGEDLNHAGISSLSDTVRWLVSRMTTLIDEDDYPSGANGGSDEHNDNGSISDNNSTYDQNNEPSLSPHETASSPSSPQTSFTKKSSRPVSSIYHSPFDLPPELKPIGASPFDPPHTQWAGFNGRANKIADTCYGFWVGGSLAILNHSHLIHSTPIRRYLCEKTQHPIAGGFGKLPGDPPDIYHSYLGLAALALLDVGKSGEEGVLARDVRHSDSDGAKDARREWPKEVVTAEHPVQKDGTANDEAEDKAGKQGQDGHEGQRVPVHEDKMASEGDVAEETTKSTSSNSQHHARRWTETGATVSVQTIDEDMMEREGGGEGGEVGDGGGVLRRLDPALCFSVRAREWLEGLSWRRELLSGDEAIDGNGGGEMKKEEAVAVES